jgi:phage terminase small subunit
MMPALKNPRHEAFAQALARGMSAAAAYGQAGFKPHRANAATLARKKHISVRVVELQEEQLVIHQQATAAAVRGKLGVRRLSFNAALPRLQGEMPGKLQGAGND